MPSSRKLALVTGASGGIGAEFAALLAADGYDLALVARSAERLESVAAALRARYGIEAVAHAIDLAESGAAAEVASRVPQCDVLINNAGSATNGPFAGIEPARIANEIALNVVALTLLSRAYLPAMIARGSGSILNVASTAGFLPGPFMAVYYATKAYVISFSQAIAEEARGTGARITCFCPGSTATGFADWAGTHATLLHKFPMADARAMAVAGYRGMRAGKDVVVPWPPSNWLVPFAARLSPRRLLLWISRKTVEVKRNDA
ncbi:MAG TPA: SDR family oxidoreductase [Candidatus Tumulicola sp.]|jgi:hypothetical protein